jgi:hypothetical protein
VYGEGRVKTGLKLLLVAVAYGSIPLFFLLGLVTASTELVSRGAKPRPGKRPPGPRLGAGP